MSNHLQRKLLELAGDSATITKSSESDWSSISFEGKRHSITFQFQNGSHGLAFVDSVRIEGENLIPLSNGYTLCDLSLVEVDMTPHLTVTVEALTLKD